LPVLNRQASTKRISQRLTIMVTVPLTSHMFVT